MPRRLICLLVLFTAWQSHAAPGQTPGSRPSNAASPANSDYTLGSFRSELWSLEAKLGRKSSAQEISALTDSLPAYWKVSTAGRSYSISTEQVKAQLRAGAPERARAWVGRLQKAMTGAEGGGANAQEARAKLDRILAGREFAALRAKSSAWEEFKSRLSERIGRMLVKLFGKMERHPWVGTVILWLALLAAVGFVALCIFRFVIGKDRMDALPSGASVVTTRSWQEWLRAAREAARSGEYRQAVHSAYWAGIVRLEDVGAVPRDRARTPREYLRVVTDSTAGDSAPSLPRKAPLAALTLRMERTWYANEVAGPQDFAEALRQLEALGCPLG